jgi:glycosyltransferase involved in cell wall biosynthesis
MADRVTQVPLLHLFVSYESEQRLLQQQSSTPTPAAQNGAPFALFFARLEPYKGIDVLLTALRQLEGQSPVQAIIAGQGDVEPYTRRGLPTNVELRNRQIGDEEAIELFKNCLVVVLPYLDATQSALVAAAYFFGKPVIVTRAGALPEYVVTGKTGWVIEPRDAPALAACLHQASSDRLTLAQMGQAGREWYMTQRRAERHALHMMYEQVRQGAAAEAN